MRRIIGKKCTTYIYLLATIGSLPIPSGAQSRISGTYVICEARDGATLQLTQAANGQITGVFSVLELDNSGNVKGDTSSITAGTLDGSQLTLTLHPGIFGTNIAGTKTGNAIRLQNIDSEGRVSYATFIRSSGSAFTTCATSLQQKSAAIKLDLSLTSQIQQFSQAIQESETWIRNAQIQAGRIPAAEDRYKQIQSAMQNLIDREKQTPNPIDRSQLSIDVNQADIDGNMLDIDVDQAWSWPIESQLKNVSQHLITFTTICAQDDAAKPNVVPAIRDAWESSCRDIRVKQTDFQSTADKIMQQRSELKTYQIASKSLREAAVKQAEKLAQ